MQQDMTLSHTICKLQMSKKIVSQFKGATHFTPTTDRKIKDIHMSKSRMAVCQLIWSLSADMKYTS